VTNLAGRCSRYLRESPQQHGPQSKGSHHLLLDKGHSQPMRSSILLIIVQSGWFPLQANCFVSSSLAAHKTGFSFDVVSRSTSSSRRLASATRMTSDAVSMPLKSSQHKAMDNNKPVIIWDVMVSFLPLLYPFLFAGATHTCFLKVIEHLLH
jgi:hypothetical protein